MPDSPLPPFLNLRAALREFVTVTRTQAQQHIRTIHRYAAIRLVLEGGFDPDEIVPHPPICVQTRSGRGYLRFEAIFDTLYATYDLRFPYIAASVKSLRRIDWDSDSPALKAIRQAGDLAAVLGYAPRLA